ncbi:M3 family metallopeptidase [Epidermidibacterium keratini]
MTLPAPADAESWLDAKAAEGLAAAGDIATRLKTTEQLSALEALELWNDMSLATSDVAALASTFSEMHPIEAVRDRGEQAIQDISKFWTELSLDAEMYAVFERLSADGVDEQADRLLEKILLDFRRSGVDKDDTTRARLQEISERMVKVGQEFAKNTRDDVRSIQLTAQQFDGLPQDWIDTHDAAADGRITVTTDYPDLIPFMTFGRDAAARRELRIASLNRGWPVNDPLLQELFALRREYAGIVGYDTWADYNAETKMIGTGPAIAEFIDKIAAAAAESGERDRAVLIERMRQDRPDAETIDGADVPYYSELVRKESFDVDAQQVRTYFDFAKVRAGLLEVTGQLFGLTYRPADDAVVWHEDVTAYDVYDRDSDERIGRIYLDLHPRDGKFKHAAQFTMASGITDRQLPEGTLACNFGRGLMEHSDVVTLFHEFGHLVHHIVAGRTPWQRFSGVATEWDFVEAPSQMLEEWAWDADVLRTFATNADGEPIPAELVEKMRRADDFGKGYDARTQMFYASMSYDFHVREVPDLTERTRELQTKYSLFPYIEGTHMPASFGHLDGYSSGYYTYMWSLVIAKDMFSAFDPENLLEPGVARRYRDAVLAPGGTKDAADLVEDFLGRPYSFEAFAAWLDR